MDDGLCYFDVVDSGAVVDYGELDEECWKDSLGADLCLATSVWKIHLGLYAQLTLILRESMPVWQCIRLMMPSCRKSALGSGINTDENVEEDHVTQALNRI
ncbi:hypothetical protein C5167_036152 [Papaver somniferum]|nr:hypothetical protein C5167_036152 [Papaver somniferum]